MSPASAALERSAPTFAALGDATRLHVVSRLSREGPLSITELSQGVELTRQAVTKHLEVLGAATRMAAGGDGPPPWCSIGPWRQRSSFGPIERFLLRPPPASG